MACLVPLKGPGMLYVIDRAAANNSAAFRFNNGSEWSLDAEVTDDALTDYTDPSFADCAADSTLSGVTFGGTGHEFSPANKVLMVQGNSVEVAAAAVSEQDYVAYLKGFVELSPLPDPTGTMLVESADGVTTYVEGTDYIMGWSGIHILESGSIVAPVDAVTANIQVTYTGLATTRIESLTNFGESEYTLILDVKNTGNLGRPERLKIHRAKPDIFTSLPQMGDTYQNYPLSFKVLPDSSITGALLSKYFIQTQVTPTQVV